MFAAVGKDDTPKEAESMASKVLKVKLWDDGETGAKWKKNVQEIDGEVLCGMLCSDWNHLACLICGSPSRCSLLLYYIYSDTPHTVSQFTLLASTKKGNKPDFHKSANAAKGKELYDTFFAQVRALYREDRVKDGVFQAMMDVGLVNDGPVGVDFRCIDEAVCMPSGTFVSTIRGAGWEADCVCRSRLRSIRIRRR